MKANTNFFATFVSGFGIVIVSMLIGFVSAPVALNYWKPERYALWALLQTVITYLNVANVGIGQAANTLIGKNTSFAVKKRILKRSAFMLAIAMCVMIIVVGTIIAANVPWYSILGKIPENLLEEAKHTCGIIVLFFFINLPFSLLTSFLIGCQKAYIENALNMISMIVNFAALLLIIALNLGLPMLALVNGLSMLAINIVRAICSFFVGKKYSSEEQVPQTLYGGDSSYRVIALTSLRFFLIWIASTLVWNTDNFVISNVIGLKEITSYSITFKFFSILVSILSLINNSIMPIMAREYGQGNWSWISNNYRRVAIIASSFGGLALVGAMTLGHDFILLWTGVRGYAGIWVFLFLSIYMYLYSLVNLNSGLVNSFNYTKGTWIIAFAEGGVKLGVSILGGYLFGVMGIAIGTMAGTLIAPFVFTYIVLHRRSGKNITYPYKVGISHFLYCVVPGLILSLLTQILVKQAMMRIIIGFVIVLAYCCVTFIVWPKDLKGFIKSNAMQLIGKITRGKNGKNSNME